MQLGLEYRDLAGWSIGTWRAGVSGLGGCWDSSIGTPGRPSIGTVRVLALEWAGFGQLECRDSPHSGTWRDSGPAGVPGLVSGLAAGLAAGRAVALAPGRAAGTSTGTEYRDGVSGRVAGLVSGLKAELVAGLAGGRAVGRVLALTCS